MEANADHPQRNEPQHQTLEDADAGGARRCGVPDQDGQGRDQKHQWNPLCRLVDVAEQDQLTACAKHADRECTEKQSSNCSERLRLSRGPINHELNEYCGSHYRKGARRAKLASESQFRLERTVTDASSRSTARTTDGSPSWGARRD